MSCVLAGVDGHVCSGRPQWHHPIKKQRVRDAFPRGAWRPRRPDPEWQSPEWEPVPRGYSVRDVSEDFEARSLAAILRDPRNRIWACWDAHQAIEGDVSRLPAPVWEFAREFGLDAQLENDIRRQA